VPQAPRHQRHREGQRGHQVARREPEAEHRRRHERGHEELRPERRGAQPRGDLDVAHAGHRARQAVAARPPQPPEAGEREQEHRRPAEEAVAAVYEQRHEPVGAREVSAGEPGVRGRLAGALGGVRRGAAVDRLVDRHVQGDREERHLHGTHRQRSPARPPYRPCGERAHHHARGHELRPEPGERPEQDEAHRRVLPPDARGQPHREQRRARQRGRCRQLRVHGRSVGQERWAQADRERGPQRPRVGYNPERQPVRQGDRQRGDRRQEQLHAARPADRVRGGDQEREPHPVRLIQPSLGPAPVRPQLVRVEVRVHARPVLVEHVHVAVVDDRVRRQQVMRLVAAVVRAGERLEPDRGGVDAEEEQPEGEGATHGAAP
jgi:hypothetical protein